VEEQTKIKGPAAVQNGAGNEGNGGCPADSGALQETASGAVVVKGEYLGHTLLYGFRYRYQCVECDRKFKTNAPEATAPVLCEFCYHGGESGDRVPMNARLKRPNRKAKHKLKDDDSYGVF